MQAYIAKKRFSIYLVLIAWGFAVAEMHPGFATIFAGTLLLFVMFVLRLCAHIEGQQMMMGAMIAHNGAPPKHSLALRELGYMFLGFALGVGILYALLNIAKHIPWLWLGN